MPWKKIKPQKPSLYKYLSEGMKAVKMKQLSIFFYQKYKQNEVFVKKEALYLSLVTEHRH